MWLQPPFTNLLTSPVEINCGTSVFPQGVILHKIWQWAATIKLVSWVGLRTYFIFAFVDAFQEFVTISKFAFKLTLLKLLGEDGTFNNYIVLWPVLGQRNSSRWVEKGNNKNVYDAAGALTPSISLPNANQPPVPLRVRRTIGLCQSHETLGYIFRTNNANGYKTCIMYKRLLYSYFPQHYQKGLYIPRLLPFIPGNEHRNRDAVSVIRVWQTRGLGRWLMETTCL